MAVSMLAESVIRQTCSNIAKEKACWQISGKRPHFPINKHIQQAAFRP